MYSIVTAGTPVTEALLDAGADVNAATPDGVTALHIAAFDLANPNLLLDRGAKVKVAAKRGETPLFIAAFRPGNAAVVRLLLSKGADPSTTILGVFTPLDVARPREDQRSNPDSRNWRESGYTRLVKIFEAP